MQFTDREQVMCGPVTQAQIVEIRKSLNLEVQDEEDNVEGNGTVSVDLNVMNQTEKEEMDMEGVSE